MKRLIVTGFPCGEVAWRKLFPDSNDQILTLAQVFKIAKSHDLRKLAKVVDQVISAGNFDHIICHDIGVTTTILALLSINKRKEAVPGFLTMFNGAFTGFDVFEARHPIWFQVKTTASIVKELAATGIDVDPEILTFFPLIRKMYRQIIAVSLLEKLKGNQVRKLNLPVSALILEGRGDPYIPKSSIDELEKIFRQVKRLYAYDGHFPYLDTGEIIHEQICELEKRVNAK
ncbi:MAG: alpha/beta hydrolase [Pseudomonadota bacterium]